MAANTAPIYSLLGDIQWGTPITVAVTAKDGTGATTLVFTADATNGGYVEKLVLRPAGTNTASVARVFINNGATPATPANNTLYDEVSLPATTLSEIAQITGVTLALGFALPPGYRIYVAIGTAVAAGWAPSIVGGVY